MKQKEVQSKNLSLGMRRRLSIAISLVAEPKIVFLDEPTTGLDPETRREVWNILTECKKRHSIVLTTHSMEEADVLCERIAIINLGVMRCIGAQTRLKNVYGFGYHLFINCQKLKYIQLLQKDRSAIIDIKKVHQTIFSFVTKILPSSKLLRSFNGNFVYQIPTAGFQAEKLFNEMETNKDQLRVADWGISQCSLEDVFTKICEI